MDPLNTIGSTRLHNLHPSEWSRPNSMPSCIPARQLWSAWSVALLCGFSPSRGWSCPLWDPSQNPSLWTWASAAEWRASCFFSRRPTQHPPHLFPVPALRGTPLSSLSPEAWGCWLAQGYTVQDWDSRGSHCKASALILHCTTSQGGELCGDYFLSFLALADKKLSAKFNVQLNHLTQS